MANAVQEVLMDPRYEGYMGTMDWCIKYIDFGMQSVITVTAFSIISFTLLKNALAGLYCTFHKFWDAVDKVHQENQDKGWIERVQGLTTGYQKVNGSSVKRLFLGMLPNIKALTDFENDTIDAKSYWISALPKMLAGVVLGAFIFNGYYRDTASKVADYGSTIFQRLVLNVDLVETFDRVMNTSGRPEFSTAGSQETRYKLANKIAEDAYDEIIHKYSDITDLSTKTAMAQDLETYALDFVQTHEDYLDGGYSYTVKTSLTLGAPDLEKLDYTSDTVVQKAISIACSDISFDSAMAPGEEWYVRTIIQFNKQANKTYVAKVTDLTLTVYNVRTDGDKTIFSVPNNGNHFISYAGEIGGHECSSKVVGDGSSKSTEITVSGNVSGTVSANLTYKSNGQAHKITKVVLKSTSGTATLSSSNMENETVNVGEGVKVKKED